VTACYVYAIAMEGDSVVLEKALKIGIARNPESRLRGLTTGSPFSMVIRKTWKFLSDADARDFEGACHKEFSAQKLMREWFSVTVQQIDEFYESYFTLADVEKEASELLHVLRLREKDNDRQWPSPAKRGRNDPETSLDTLRAAAYLGKSASWLNKSRMTGTGPIYHKLGGNVRYTIRDLDNWRDERRRTAIYDHANTKVA